MERRMWIVALLISSHAVELIIAQHDFCAANPTICQNSGTCTFRTSFPYYVCSCVGGYYGDNCEAQWTIKTASKFEIYISSSFATDYNAAKKLCVNNAGIMVRLDDEQVRSKVYAAIKSSSIYFFWVGATGKMRDWKWLDGTSVQKNILNWYEHQPDNYDKNEPRLLLRNDGKYGDIKIAYQFAKTICLREIVLRRNNRTLTIHRHYSNGNSKAVYYNTAKSRCKSRSSRLAVLDDTTRSILPAHLKQNEYHWVATPGTTGCQAFAKNGLASKNCASTLAYICEKAGPYAVTTANLTLTETSAQEINCSADGFPVPSVVWKKGDVTITAISTDGVYQINSNGLARLITENAKLTDEGTYHCVASNTFDGSKYESTANAQLKVPSTPTILSIEPQSCNSSFSIKWKPHERAVGVEHTIRIRRDEMPYGYEERVAVTPSNGEQYFVSRNLSSSTLYSVLIYTSCKSCPSTAYTGYEKNYTGGIPRPVQAASLLQANDDCMVDWNWPANTPRHLLTAFKVETRLTTARVPTGTNVSTEIEEVMTTSPSFNITMRPNRNHTVTITSQTCAGFGKEVVAAGGCVSKVAAPTEVPKPDTSSGASEVSDDGELSFNMTVPSQTNGPISCIFVMVEIGNSATVNGINETELKIANETGNGSRVIAIAMEPQSFGGKSKLNITLGDESTSTCNIHNQEKKRYKRATFADENYFGQNEALSKEKSYRIYIVTSTPSDDEVLFKISEPLEVSASSTGPGKEGSGISTSQDWLIPVVVVVAVLVVTALVVAGIILKRRSTKQRPTSERNEELENVDFSKNEIVADGSIRVSPPRHERNQAAAVAGDESQDQVLYENCKIDTRVQMSDFEEYYSRLRREECSLFKSQFKAILEQAAAAMQSTSFAANPELKKKNRYKNILPFNSTRVVIEGNESGYINACYINGFDMKRKFIATQGPLPSTVNDFWLMVAENQCGIVVMLTKCFEAGKKKCQKYWPEEGKSEKYGAITVQNKAEIKSCGFISRKFQVSYEGGAIELLQFQYLNWPDHGAPKTTSTLFRMHKAVVKSWKEKRSSSPMIVHCSAGAGRTGTFIGYDYLLEQSSQEDQADAFNCVLKMRSQRVDMVQNCDQYILVHTLILEHYLFADTNLDSHELTQKLEDMNGRGSSRELSTEFDNLSRLTPVKGTSTKANSENVHAVLVIPRPNEMAPPKLNSAWVESYDENSPMIAAQAPDNSSVSIFWRAVSDNRVNTIVTLSVAKEHKQYWPNSVGETVSFDNVAVCLLSEDRSSAIVERTIQITNGSKRCIVTQYHYPEWDAINCPDNSQDILELVDKMQRSTRKEKGSAVLIHCSDGIGRTGTFCAIVNLIERLKTENRVDVFRAVKDLRDCRTGMVRSLDQYLFCHRVVSDYLKSFDIYSNFG